jgi:hypothetical protein
LKELMTASGWLLFDADNPAGMPEVQKRLGLAERLDLFDRPGFLPGISRCRRIEYRGSSTRVVQAGSTTRPGATHALIEVNDPAKLVLFASHVKVTAVKLDLTFQSPNHSCKQPGTIVGYTQKTVFDLVVWVGARLIFNARPDVRQAKGFRVIDAGVRIVNPDGGVLDIGWIKAPDKAARKVYQAKTGIALDPDEEGGLTGRVRGQLKLDTEIEVKGAVEPLSHWLVFMFNNDIDHLRCEAPFRDSYSEAAFIRILANGEVFVHDSGEAANYYLDHLPLDDDEAGKNAASFGEYEVMAEVIAARARQDQRQVNAAFAASGDGEGARNCGNGSGNDGGGGNSGGAGDASGGDDDEAPVNLWRTAEAPDLPTGLLPPRVERFVRANAKAIGADAAGLAGAVLAVLAGAIPDRIKLQVMTKGKKWLVAARIWVALVGDPGTKKTPIIDTALAALRVKDVERRRRYADLKAFWDAGSKQAKAAALAAGQGPPAQNRLIIGDTTYEAATEVLATSPDGVLGVYDELGGWFGQMERYAGGSNGKGASDRAFWLKARNGGPHSLDRIVRGISYIENLSIAILGGIQPGPMIKVASANSDDGLIQRLTPIMLKPAGLTDETVDTEAVDTDFADLIDALLALTPGDQPLRFDAGAQKIRREMEIEHHDHARDWGRINKKLATAFDKQDGFFAELCVIFHAALNAGRNPLPLTVEESTARLAADFMRRFLRPHLIAFCTGLLDLSDDNERLVSVAGYILVHKPDTMNSREVQKAVRSMRKAGARDVAILMEQLEAFGWLFRHPSPPRSNALPVWKVNPEVHVRFAERAKEEAAARAKARATIAKDAAARRAAQG